MRAKAIITGVACFAIWVGSFYADSYASETPIYLARSSDSYRDDMEKSADELKNAASRAEKKSRWSKKKNSQHGEKTARRLRKNADENMEQASSEEKRASRKMRKSSKQAERYSRRSNKTAYEKMEDSKQGDSKYKKRNISVNVNTATEKELTQLKGIGKKIAKRIIEYRQENGKFNDMFEFRRVHGIKSSVIQKNKKAITFD